ncbi:MAG: hypothetical protein Q8Q09_16210 [Deltaproteobacteria bacterium]|nr:hypothetical protein [Deltaproteobacteria bacterium]
MTVYLVRFDLDPQRYHAPILQTSAAPTVEHWLRDPTRDPLDWPVDLQHDLATVESWSALRSRALGDALSLRIAPPLAQCVVLSSEQSLTARYLFDARYAWAHPQSIDPGHLALVHGIIQAKLYDEGALILDPAGIEASLRWRLAHQRATTLHRDGRRERR